MDGFVYLSQNSDSKINQIFKKGEGAAYALLFHIGNSQNIGYLFSLAVKMSNILRFEFERLGIFNILYPKYVIVHQEPNHLRLSNNITCKLLSQYHRHSNRLFVEIFL